MKTKEKGDSYIIIQATQAGSFGQQAIRRPGTARNSREQMAQMTQIPTCEKDSVRVCACISRKGIMF